MKIIDTTMTKGVRSLSYIPTLIKTNMIHRILARGTNDMEVTSFERHPQFEDRDELIKSLPKANVNYYAHAINLFAYEQIRTYKQINGVSITLNAKDLYKSLCSNKNLESNIGFHADILKDTKGSFLNRVFLDNGFDPCNGVSARFYIQPIIHELFKIGAHEIILVDNDRYWSAYSFERLSLEGLNVGVDLRDADKVNAYSKVVSEII